MWTVGKIVKSVPVIFVGVMAVGFLGNAMREVAVAPRVQPPLKAEADEAIEQCQGVIRASYGFWSVKGWPTANDRWRDHGGNGTFDSLWTVAGKNQFGVPMQNVIECEASRKADGSWELPYLWNATLMGRLDPGTLDRPGRLADRRSRIAPQASRPAPAKRRED